MKLFTDLPPRQPQSKPVSQPIDRQLFIKKNLAKVLDRSQTVIDAVFEWLMSFSTGMTKVDFEKKVIKLDKDDEKALQQLRLSKGKRTICSVPRVLPPTLDVDIITAIANYQNIAIEAKEGRAAIDNFLASVGYAGDVYVLDIHEVMAEYKDYKNRGNSASLFESALRANILAVVGLEKPVSFGGKYELKDMLFQLVATRKKNPDKYTLSTWNYTHAWYIPEYAELFKHFSVGRV